MELYAPVFAGKTYRFAEPIEDYAAVFKRELGGIGKCKPGLFLQLHLELPLRQARREGDAAIFRSHYLWRDRLSLLNQTLVYAQIV